MQQHIIYYFNPNVTAHLHVHKYHKTPHVVTSSFTLINSDKNLCENSFANKSFSKHSTDWYHFSLWPQRNSHTTGRFFCMMTEAIFNFYRKIHIYMHQYIISWISCAEILQPSLQTHADSSSLFSFQTGRSTSSNTCQRKPQNMKDTRELQVQWELTLNSFMTYIPRD